MNDEIVRLRKAHSLLVSAAEQFRPLQAEVDAMRLRGDPRQQGMVLAVRRLLKVLDGEAAP